MSSFSRPALEAIHREKTKIHIEQVRFLEQFQEKFRALVNNYVSPARLIVFVDDLDRCMPAKAIEVLEAIKLFVDAPGCVFLLGLDQEAIARGVEIRYKHFELKTEQELSISGTRYPGKIIQLPFQIPPIETTHMDGFVKGLVDEWPCPECPGVFARGVGENPRQVKRTVNTFLMLWGMADKRNLRGLIQPIRLAKVVAIQHISPSFYNLIKKNHSLLRDVEAYFVLGERIKSIPRKEGEDINKNQFTEFETLPEAQLPRDLLALLNETPSVRKILNLFVDLPDAIFKNVSYDELKVYFTLTRRAEALQPVRRMQVSDRGVYGPQMIRIPAGKILMGASPEQARAAIELGADSDWVEFEQPQHTLFLPDYLIGRYPVTNQQYLAFINDTGYEPPDGWDSNSYQKGKDAHPVVGVSWEDATNYCKWLSEKTNKLYRIPTEPEWEKAARGNEGLMWSWGNEFGENNANTEELNISDTTPVGQFSPQGDSPFGCADMIGNVWECRLRIMRLIRSTIWAGIRIVRPLSATNLVAA